MTRPDEPACFVVHSRRHFAAALAAGAASGRPIVVLSGEGASAYAGADWFMALVRDGGAEFPEVALTAIFDCTDRAGDALAALKAGIRDIVFTGHPEAARRLAAIAAARGARLHDRRPPAIDLLDARDPARVALAAVDG